MPEVLYPDISSLPELVKFLTVIRAAASELVTLVQSSKVLFHILSVLVPRSILNTRMNYKFYKPYNFDDNLLSCSKVYLISLLL
jgi:hypothetical protein